MTSDVDIRTQECRARADHERRSGPRRGRKGSLSASHDRPHRQSRDRTRSLSSGDSHSHMHFSNAIGRFRQRRRQRATRRTDERDTKRCRPSRRRRRHHTTGATATLATGDGRRRRSFLEARPLRPLRHASAACERGRCGKTTSARRCTCVHTSAVAVSAHMHHATHARGATETPRRTCTREHIEMPSSQWFKALRPITILPANINMSSRVVFGMLQTCDGRHSSARKW